MLRVGRVPPAALNAADIQFVPLGQTLAVAKKIEEGNSVENFSGLSHPNLVRPLFMCPDRNPLVALDGWPGDEWLLLEHEQHAFVAQRGKPVDYLNNDRNLITVLVQTFHLLAYLHSNGRRLGCVDITKYFFRVDVHGDLVVKILGYKQAPKSCTRHQCFNDPDEPFSWQNEDVHSVASAIFELLTGTPPSTTTENDPYPYTSLMDVDVDTYLILFLRGCLENRMSEETLAAELHNQLIDFAEEKFPGMLLNPTKIPVPPRAAVLAHAVKVVEHQPAARREDGGHEWAGIV